MARTIGWPVDAHVHLHCLEDVPATLDAAAGHFSRVGATASDGPLGALLLTQTSREHVFESLSERASVGAWALRRLKGEEVTLAACRGERSLLLVCGRQVRADDGLEVAAFGTLREFQDGRSFAESLDEVVDSGAVAAIPWGFGKWVGKRGKRVNEVLNRRRNVPVLLGDSGSRAGLLGEPRLIRRGRRRGVRVVAGTDPFPFGGDLRRVGSFGVLADRVPDAEAPWGSLRSWLLDPRTSLVPYGRASGPWRFLVNQFVVQWYNRRLGGAPR